MGVANRFVWCSLSLALMSSVAVASEGLYNAVLPTVTPVQGWASKAAAGELTPWANVYLMKAARGPFSLLSPPRLEGMPKSYCYQVKAVHFVAQSPSAYAKSWKQSTPYLTDSSGWGACDELATPWLTPVLLWVTAPTVGVASQTWQSWVDLYHGSLTSQAYPDALNAKTVESLQGLTSSVPKGVFGGVLLTKNAALGGDWYTLTATLRYPAMRGEPPIPALAVPIKLEVELSSPERVTWAQAQLLPALVTKYNLLAVAESLSRRAPTFTAAKADGWTLYSAEWDISGSSRSKGVPLSDQRVKPDEVSQERLPVIHDPNFNVVYSSYIPFRAAVMADADRWERLPASAKTVALQKAFLSDSNNWHSWDTTGAMSQRDLAVAGPLYDERGVLLSNNTALTEDLLKSVYVQYVNALSKSNFSTGWLLFLFAILGAGTYWFINRRKG